MTVELLTFKEARQILGIKSPATLRKYIELGLPVVKVGTSKKILKSDLDDFIKNNRIIQSKQAHLSS